MEGLGLRVEGLGFKVSGQKGTPLFISFRCGITSTSPLICYDVDGR